ncbi:MAG: FtsX-like permease family protein [Lawsonibacter sp.]|jgi:putative ABC transport system permease protein|nr:FtsX-like permease family protein [Lawsonibacter sp.]
MRITKSFSLALKNIASSKVRTLLTMLGIIIGVAAVIVIVGLGSGLENYIADSFSSMGTNTLTVTVQSRGATRTMEVDDMYDIVADHPEELELCSPTVSMAGGVKIGTETTSTSVSGVSEDYNNIYGYTISQGRGLQYSDIAARARVCVVGAYVNQAWFGGNAVGQTLRVGGQTLTIVGVLSQREDAMEEGGSDDCLYLPYSTAARLGSSRVSSYVVTMVDEDRMDRSKAVLERSLTDFFGSGDYYNIITMSELLDAMTGMINILVGVLAGIAAISLVVGGIGIMNIMLVSVTERTREIGVRKSLGAKERTIMEQFVIEAAVTSALGGIIGIGLGYFLSAAATVVVAKLMGEALTVAPTLFAVLMAFGISAGIGVLFGYLPAKKAARLNPIDALHYD